MSRLDEVLDQLESRLAPDGTVTDAAWTESIRLEHEWIEEDERVVVLHGPSRSAAELDALQLELGKRGISLPPDYRAFLERYGGLALEACAEGEAPAAAGELGSGLCSLPRLAEYPGGAPQRLVFFENLELGYFAFEFGDDVVLVDQSGDWGGRSVSDSRTVMPHDSFTDWLATYLDSGLMTFSYQLVEG